MLGLYILWGITAIFLVGMIGYLIYYGLTVPEYGYERTSRKSKIMFLLVMGFFLTSVLSGIVTGIMLID